VIDRRLVGPQPMHQRLGKTRSGWCRRDGVTDDRGRHGGNCV